MRARYAREKFGVAVNALATGTGSIKERLLDAYLSFYTLNVKDFPPELQKDWLDINNALTEKEPTYNEKGEPIVGKAHNSIKAMTDEQCGALAQKIYDMNFKLRLEN